MIFGLTNKGNEVMDEYASAIILETDINMARILMKHIFEMGQDYQREVIRKELGIN